MASKRLIWLCPEFTPYHEALFSCIASDPDVSLRVEAMRGSVESHPFNDSGKRPYDWAISSTKGVDRSVIDRVLADKDAQVVVSSYLYPTLLKTMAALAKRKRPFVYWTDTPLSQSVEWNSGKPRRRSFLRRIARRHRLNWIFSHAKTILATGDSGVKAVIELGCPPEKAVSFPYWIQVASEEPKIARIPSPPVMSAIGQLIHRKAYDVALRAFAVAMDTGLSPDTRLIIGGEGPEKRRLFDLAIELEIDERVVFLGWIESHQKQILLESSSLFIHPARWEPYGVVVLEAMERGIPVLGSDKTCAVLDRIQDGGSGRIHRTDDYLELASHMVECMSSEAKLLAMRKEARARAKEWPLSRAIETLNKIFEWSK